MARDNAPRDASAGEAMAGTYACAEHRRSFSNRDDYLAHRSADHMHVPADSEADTDEIRRERDVETDRDPLAGTESAQSVQSDQADDPDQRMVGTGMTEDYPAELEHSDPDDRDVHRAPVPGPTKTDNG